MEHLFVDNTLLETAKLKGKIVSFHTMKPHRRVAFELPSFLTTAPDVVIVLRTYPTALQRG
jgi:hypothetical protein